VLLVATSTSTPTANEIARKTLIQSFGCYVTLIDDDATQSAFNTAVLSNDVAYVSVDANATSVGTKLVSAEVGVVNENASLIDEFGIASTSSTTSGTSVTRLDTGSTAIFNSSQTIITASGMLSLDDQHRALSGTDKTYIYLEGGSRRYDSGYIVGRRVQLPWGNSSFATSQLTTAGQNLMKEAILWAGGCVGRWSMDETSGTTATDTSGKNTDGTLTVASFASNSIAPAKLVNGLDLNGSSAYITVPNNRWLQTTTALSISAWIKADTLPNSAKTIVRKGGANPNNYQFAIYNGKLSLNLDTSDAVGIVGTTTLATGVWYNVVATWDGSTVKLYINGQLDNSPGTSRSGTIGKNSQSEPSEKTLNLFTSAAGPAAALRTISTA
jgi:hypothetical protein